MPIRPFCADDAARLAELARSCARGETDFVLTPLWENERDLFAEFDRHGIDPGEHLRVAEAGDGTVTGCVGFVRRPEAITAGMVCPIVAREERGHGLGGELLRAGLALAGELGIKVISAAIGVRNRAGYSLLTALGFRPARQHFLMRLDAAPSAAPAPIEGVELAAATPDDAEGILRIYRECGFEERAPDAMRAALADGRHAHAVARRAGDVVAFCEIETQWPQRPWVAFVGVEPELRDRGVGSALTTWTLARQFEAGATRALLLLSPGNRTAVRAYEKVGFRRHRLIDVLERTV